MPFFANLPILVLILVSVLLNASAQIFLRLSARSGFASGGEGPVALVFDLLTRPALIGGLACYGLSILLWIYVLSRAEASYAYPFLGLGFVVVALAGWLLLGETMSIQRFGATALIVVGVAWLART
jgi:multidrug transporter EmrE-like cation transporter